MKLAKIEKSGSERGASAEQMGKVNAYSHRELGPEEVFVFPLILCDNEIDRDLERFSKEALAKLAELYLGKTGVFDHAPSAGNQSARIFDTQLIEEAEETSLGEPLVRLKAWAYMVRCEKNADLILEIEAGIKKEVSVGCAVEEIVCSVCGANTKAEACGHVKGREYGGMPCHYILRNPTDAYEWSFVAIPAQRGAGVTKGRAASRSKAAGSQAGAIEKLFDAKGTISLDPREIASIKAHIIGLESLAEDGCAFGEELRHKMVRLMAISQPELDAGTVEQVAKVMDLDQVREFCRVFERSAAKSLPLRPQTAGPKRREAAAQDAYRV